MLNQCYFMVNFTSVGSRDDCQIFLSFFLFSQYVTSKFQVCVMLKIFCQAYFYLFVSLHIYFILFITIAMKSFMEKIFFQLNIKYMLPLIFHQSLRTMKGCVVKNFKSSSLYKVLCIMFNYSISEIKCMLNEKFDNKLRQK